MENKTIQEVHSDNLKKKQQAALDKLNTKTMTTVESKMKDVLIEHSTIVNEANSDEGVWSESYITISEKCAAIIQEVAVSFIEWWYKTDGEELENHGDTWDALYQHFITHIYK